MGLKQRQQVIMARGSVSFSTLLAVLFIGLKLTDHIDWSWFWVLAPLWMPIVVVLLAAVVLAFFID